MQNPHLHDIYSKPVAYPELVSRGVSERRKCKWLVRIDASNGVTPLIKKILAGGGFRATRKLPWIHHCKHISQITKLYPYSLQSYWTSKFRKIIPYAIFAQKRTLPCVTKIILTAKLFGVGSSNFGFVHLDNWATHSKNLNKIRRRSAWGFLKICSFDVE